MICAAIRRLRGDRDGGVMVEMTVLLPIFLVFVLGGAEFLFIFYQWNAAAKSVEVGARIAAVSDPVANGLKTLSVNVVNNTTVYEGDPMPAFTVTCNGPSNPNQCSCAGAGCANAVSYNLSAMQKIVYGRAAGTSCNTSSSYYFAGMCNFRSGLAPSNVQVVYSQTGLGYAGREDGPKPTVTVSLRAVTVQYFFLSWLLGASTTLPSFTTTITGEVLSAAAQ